jgi:hypothetical protein
VRRREDLVYSLFGWKRGTYDRDRRRAVRERIRLRAIPRR